MLYPLTFHPVFKERIWGGRNMAGLFGKSLPAGVPIGESWEITDRPEGVSVVANGPLAGRDLRWLMAEHGAEVLGRSQMVKGRFPLLVKILDAEQTLSVQVHPPVSAAERLNGEPKTELWHVVHAVPGAELYAGLKQGVSRGQFEASLGEGRVAECLHTLPAAVGQTLFLPSGRVHAIGAGLVIFEIQQNSDTTYRVFDWNRKDEAGNSRELHVAQSMQSIDFDDFEPMMAAAEFSEGNVRSRQLVDCPYFSVHEHEWSDRDVLELPSGRATVVGLVSGNVTIRSGSTLLELNPGQFSLIPGCLESVTVEATGPARLVSAVAA